MNKIESAFPASIQERETVKTETIKFIHENRLLLPIEININGVKIRLRRMPFLNEREVLYYRSMLQEHPEYLIKVLQLIIDAENRDEIISRLNSQDIFQIISIWENEFSYITKLKDLVDMFPKSTEVENEIYPLLAVPLDIIEEKAIRYYGFESIRIYNYNMLVLFTRLKEAEDARNNAIDFNNMLTAFAAAQGADINVKSHSETFINQSKGIYKNCSSSMETTDLATLLSEMRKEKDRKQKETAKDG